ncbi:MAG: class II aldolase/adducin family protein [Acidiferrobacterales bacterium]
MISDLDAMHQINAFMAIKLMAAREDVLQDTHGNVSMRLYDGHHDAFFNTYMWIKPSGVPYNDISAEDLVLMRRKGDPGSADEILHGHRKPSVDAVHHLTIYQNNPHIGAICHTHSPHVVAFAISELPIPCVSTEQADYFGGPIRCLPYADLNEWGKTVKVEQAERAVLLGHHGLLTFAGSAYEAVNLAIQLENLARKQFIAQTLLQRNLPVLPKEEVDKWHERYMTKYGQR